MAKSIKFAEIRESKNRETGEPYKYFKVVKDVTLTEGSKIYYDTPQNNINRLLDLGFIDETEAEERLSKVPDWKIFEFTLKLDN